VTNPGPTPTPNHTMSPSPPPTSTPSTTGITLLPDTTGRFGLTQIFDWDGIPSHTPLTTAQIDSLAPHEDSVWGAFEPAAWNSAHPGMIVSRYMLPVEDDNSVSGHDLTYWQNTDPDWILYACDASTGNPTSPPLLAWSGTGFPDVPLNFSNNQVIQYQLQTLMIPYLKPNGYNALAVDNTDLLNYLEGGNPRFGQPIVKGDYGCGYYDASGTFHKIFSGPLDSGSDSGFVNAMMNWVTTAAGMLHAAGLKLIINHPLYNPPTNPNEAALLAVTDAMVYEEGFTDYGRYQSDVPGIVTTALQWGEYAQSHHVAFLITDYLCYNGVQPFNGNAPCPSDPNQLPAPQVDWSLATYALVNEGGADVYISPQLGQAMSYRPEYSTTYGAPCGAYTQIAPNVYERKFQGALVIVNASGAPYAFTFPSGHPYTNYTDIEHRPLSSTLMMSGADGYVLLTNNGCS